MLTVVKSCYVYISFTAFYEEEVVSSKAEQLKQIEKQIEMQKKSTSGMTKKVAELHQHTKSSTSTSEQYSEEVLEWQKLAKKDKSAVTNSSIQEQKFVATVRL